MKRLVMDKINIGVHPLLLSLGSALMLSACGAEPQGENEAATDAPSQAAVDSISAEPVGGTAMDDAGVAMTDEDGTTPTSDDGEAPEETEAPQSTADASAPGTAEETSETAQPAAQTVAATADGEKFFTQCKICHSLESGKNGVGPSLHGIYGKAAGSVDGFSYSPAMRASGLSWTDEALDSYLEAPMKVVPGTKMAFAGVRSAEERQALISYIRDK